MVPTEPGSGGDRGGLSSWRERFIGSTVALEYTSDERGGTITHKPEVDYLDDGPEADPHLESHRPSATAGRRQFQR